MIRNSQPICSQDSFVEGVLDSLDLPSHFRQRLPDVALDLAFRRAASSTLALTMLILPGQTCYMPLPG